MLETNWKSDTIFQKWIALYNLPIEWVIATAILLSQFGSICFPKERKVNS